MYLGILLVSGLAFACSTELIPELNEQLKLVPFTEEFKTKLTASMIVDYGGCWLVERALKWGFSDFRPKDIALRRPEQMEREEKRQAVEKAEEERKKEEAKAEAARKKQEVLEAKRRELMARWGVPQQ
jgi:cation-transporting ATPase 13A1